MRSSPRAAGSTCRSWSSGRAPERARTCGSSSLYPSRRGRRANSAATCSRKRWPRVTSCRWTRTIACSRARTRCTGRFEPDRAKKTAPEGGAEARQHRVARDDPYIPRRAAMEVLAESAGRSGDHRACRRRRCPRCAACSAFAAPPLTRRTPWLVARLAERHPVHFRGPLPSRISAVLANDCSSRPSEPAISAYHLIKRTAAFENPAFHRSKRAHVDREDNARDLVRRGSPAARRGAAWLHPDVPIFCATMA